MNIDASQLFEQHENILTDASGDGFLMHIKRGWMENGLLGLTESTVGIAFSQTHFGMTLRRKKGKIRYYLIQFLTISTNVMVKAIIPVTKRSPHVTL